MPVAWSPFLSHHSSIRSKLNFPPLKRNNYLLAVAHLYSHFQTLYLQIDNSSKLPLQCLKQSPPPLQKFSLIIL